MCVEVEGISCGAAEERSCGTWLWSGVGEDIGQVGVTKGTLKALQAGPHGCIFWGVLKPLPALTSN